MACVLLCLTLSVNVWSVILCVLHWILMAGLCSCVTFSEYVSKDGLWSCASYIECEGLAFVHKCLTLSAKCWHLFLCVLPWVPRVYLWALVTYAKWQVLVCVKMWLTLSDKSWSVFLCVYYTEWQGLVCVMVSLVHWVSRVGLCSGVLVHWVTMVCLCTCVSLTLSVKWNDDLCSGVSRTLSNKCRSVFLCVKH